MEAKPQLEQTMQEEQIRTALNAHWHASAVGDANAEHDIYDDDAICDYPQSGERILGRSNLQALRSHHPGKPSGFNVKRILGNGDLWITVAICPHQRAFRRSDPVGHPIRGDSCRIVASLDRKCLGAKMMAGMKNAVRGIFDKETRRKPLASAADALSYGI